MEDNIKINLDKDFIIDVDFDMLDWLDLLWEPTSINDLVNNEIPE